MRSAIRSRCLCLEGMEWVEVWSLEIDRRLVVCRSLVLDAGEVAA